MTPFHSLIESIAILVGLILCVMWLKHRRIVTDDHRQLFSRLVTDFALPCLILVNLAKSPGLTAEHLLPAGLMFAAITITGTLAWGFGRLLRLERSVTGSLVMVAGVGSSSTLGYSLVAQVYGDVPGSMQDALIIGEFGVILPLFTFGVVVAMYFGRERGGGAGLWAEIVPFFRSAMFLALIIGLLLGWVGVPEQHWLIRTVFTVLETAGDSLSLLVAFCIGLMLKPVAVKALLPLIAVVGLLKLVVEPLLASQSAGVLSVTTVEQQILILEAAMPSGTIAAVIAARYGCDATIAANLVIATYALSLLTLPLIFLATGAGW